MEQAILASATGKLSRHIFSDQDVYAQEQSTVFQRTWLLIGHETMVPEPGDYVTTSMGEDLIILVRDRTGELHALLNSCRHRGNKVCLLDSGTAERFTCGYHGWSYELDGTLGSVPFLSGAYFDRLDTGSLGLVAVPRVQVRAGLVFACWDPDPEPLEDYLGDMGWYLDNLLLAQWGDGVEVVQAYHGYRLRANWKILAENFSGDHYHTFVTHRSAFKLDVASADGYEEAQRPDGPFEIALPGGHGIGGVYVGDRMYEQDLAAARKLGLGKKEVDYIVDRHNRQKAAMKQCPIPPYRASHGTVFPNFSFSGRTNALGARGLYVWHPRGPVATEARQWIIVERDAPEAIKELAVQSQAESGQIATGMFGQDDAENFELVTASTQSPRAKQVPFDLSMSLHIEGRWPGQEKWQTEGLPGLVGPRFSEHSQRRFYARWAEQMGDDR